MFNVKCQKTDCQQGEIEFTFLGSEACVWCGGCGAALEPYNQQDDPEKNNLPFGGTNE